MNLPNKITLARIFLIPVFMAVLMCGSYCEWQFYGLAAAVVFAAASLTDGIDGHIARSRGLVTDFGKFLDPLADKLLVSTALVCFVQLDWIPAYMAVIIIAREFIVTGLRTVAASKGIVMAAIMTGKIKTTIQIIAILCTMLLYGMEFKVCGYPGAGFIAMAVSTVFTIYSGVEYLVKNRSLLSDM